jgi:hypothetical protein
LLTTVVFLGLTGVAVMLGLMQNQFHWVLVLVPGTALLLVVVSILRALKPWQTKRFPELRAQLDSDVQALRMAA